MYLSVLKETRRVLIHVAGKRMIESGIICTMQNVMLEVLLNEQGYEPEEILKSSKREAATYLLYVPDVLRTEITKKSKLPDVAVYDYVNSIFKNHFVRNEMNKQT